MAASNGPLSDTEIEMIRSKHDDIPHLEHVEAEDNASVKHCPSAEQPAPSEECPPPGPCPTSGGSPFFENLPVSDNLQASENLQNFDDPQDSENPQDPRSLPSTQHLEGESTPVLVEHRPPSEHASTPSIKRLSPAEAILKQLEASIAAIQQTMPDGKVDQWTDQTESLIDALCMALRHGLRQSVTQRIFASEASFWPVVYELTDKDSLALIRQLPERFPLFKSPRERERAWIILNLNEGVLATIIHVIGSNLHLIRRHYTADAIFLTDDILVQLISLVERACALSFNLNFEDYIAYKAPKPKKSNNFAIRDSENTAQTVGEKVEKDHIMPREGSSVRSTEIDQVQVDEQVDLEVFSDTIPIELGGDESPSSGKRISPVKDAYPSKRDSVIDGQVSSTSQVNQQLDSKDYTLSPTNNPPIPMVPIHGSPSTVESIDSRVVGELHDIATRQAAKVPIVQVLASDPEKPASPLLHDAQTPPPTNALQTPTFSLGSLPGDQSKKNGSGGTPSSAVSLKSPPAHDEKDDVNSLFQMPRMSLTTSAGFFGTLLRRFSTIASSAMTLGQAPPPTSSEADVLSKEEVTKGESVTLQLEQICPNRGLDHQEFKCIQCSQLIGFGEHPWAMHCDVSGDYYCPGCFGNTQLISPARITHNWDFALYPTAERVAKQVNDRMSTELFDLPKLNPLLVSLIEQFGPIVSLRNRLMPTIKILEECSSGIYERLQEETIASRKHLLQTNNLYCLQDLIEIQQGVLDKSLQNLINLITAHILQECQECTLKGDHCHICQEGERLYGFEGEGKVQCGQHGLIAHWECYQKRLALGNQPTGLESQPDADANANVNVGGETTTSPQNDRQPSESNGPFFSPLPTDID